MSSISPLFRPTAALPLDFAGQSLRGRNFKRQDLTDADFSGADIRGANFTNAILRGANFTGAKAGIQKRWVVGQFVISFVLSVVLNFVAVFINAIFVGVLLTSNETKELGVFFGLAILFLNAIVVYAIARQGLTTKAMGTITGAGAGALAFAVALAVAVALAGAFADAGTGAITIAFAVVGAVAGAVAGAVGGAVAVAIAVAIARAVTVAVALAVAIAVAVAVAVAVLLLSGYVAWRVSKEDEKFALARSIGVALGAIGGTSFRGADLTNANFSQALLKSTNFNHSKQKQTLFTHTCWKNAKKLDRARVGDSILASPAVRKLLVSGNGINQSYVRANLREANLNGAKLNGANLKWADLSGATLQQTDLQNANLAETLALRTHFTEAFLTGACLEAWNIDSTTCLEDIDCQFVYLLEDQQERRPSSGDFSPGEFTKLFQEVLSTVDLIFRNGVDWKAFVAAFQTVQADNEDTELTIQSIENKGDGVVVVRVNAPPEADKAELHSQFNQQYETALKALDAKYQAQLQAKDDQIAVHRQQSADMKEIVSLLANRPVTVEVKAIAESKSMNDSTDKSQNIQVGRDMNFSNSVLNLGELSGTVTNTIQQLPDDGDRATLKDLLTQLQGAIDADTQISTDDKAEALEQVKVLAEAGKNPQDGAVQKAAKTAAKILKGTVAALPSTTALVEAVTKLLPLITKFFGF